MSPNKIITVVPKLVDFMDQLKIKGMDIGLTIIILPRIGFLEVLLSSCFVTRKKNILNQKRDDISNLKAD